MKLQSKAKKNSGFTIAELLIVISIMVLLVGISVPTFSSALTKARIASDMTNLQNIAAEYTAEAVLRDMYNDDGKIIAPTGEFSASNGKICITIGADDAVSVAVAAADGAVFTTSVVNVKHLKAYKGVLGDDTTLDSGEFAWDSSTGTFVYSEDDGGTVSAGTSDTTAE